MKKALSLILAVMMLLSLMVPAYADDAQTATGKGTGIDGEVIVEVKADANTIYEVTVLQQNETPGIGSVAVEKLPGAIVEANSIEVDGISGATVTSTAIKTAVTEALTSMGFDPAAYAGAASGEAAPKEKEDVTLDCDVVVVGAGGAGLTASVMATQQGMKVILLEKMPFVGGNSLRAEGGMNAADTKVQAELGLEGNTVDNFVDDTLRLGHDLADPDLVRTLAENSAEAVDWLFSIDAPLEKVKATGGTQHQYLHQPADGQAVGSYLVAKLSAKAEELGIDVRVNTKATEILMDNGRAVGVKAEDEDHNYTINAKSVVLATGGFGANFDLMASYDPSLANAVTTNHAGAQGDGIMMAQAVGADTVDMEQIQLHPTVIQSNGLLVSESLRSYGAVIVNTEGKRFVNDLAGRDVVSQAELKQPDGYCYIIFDQNLVDHLALTKKFIDGGYALTGDTYVALAREMGLEGDAVENFVNTMVAWNESCAKGLDEEWGRNNGMEAQATAPFYAIKIAPGIHHTMGGIKIDEKAEVIDTDGNVIPGLFACGETTGGIHGGNRVGGNAVCDFIVFGRIAGQSAADFAKGGASGTAAAAEEPVDVATATAKAPGIGGDVVVEVKADAATIYEVNILEQNETPGIGSVAAEKLPAAMVAGNTVDVDAITGATVTSTAIKTAVTEALTSLGFDPAAYTGAPAEAAAPAEKAEETLDCDVVVIGAGGAGMTAAITATDAGKNVILLESTAFPGGNSVRSTGGMNAGPTEWRNQNEFKEAAGVEATLKKVANYPDNARIQELGKIVAEQWEAYQAAPEGYFDTSELFQLDTMIGGGGKNDPALVQKLVESSPDAIAWLDSLNPEIILHNVAAFGGASVKRIHRPVDENGKVISVGAYVVPLLQQNLENRGIKLMTDTPAVEILMDNGQAVGVKAEGPDANYTINAKAVVIASGGFGANNDMIKAVRPELDGFITTNAPGIQGQGIQMAQAVGADTVDMAEIQLHPTVHVEGTSANLITEGLRGDGAILVNQEGKRFFDEVSTRDKVSAAEFEQTGGYAWLIVDSRMSDASNVIQGYINKGFAEKGETWEELAGAIGAPADVLAETMAAWNACVEAKEDKEFGRVSFANPLDQAPFYAIKVQPGVHHTMGGIKINDNAEVIGTDGAVIPGLFAAGETTGGVHGNNRLGGNAVADFTIFGRIAGQSAADFAADELANAA
ncbi:MAG: flavocytochrome c [Oscillospiraceae bacterium]|nr:flavocytochrome c [Oscillospiraceae bacterium]